MGVLTANISFDWCSAMIKLTFDAVWLCVQQDGWSQAVPFWALILVWGGGGGGGGGGVINLSGLQLVAFHLADTFYAKHFTVH